MRKRHVSAHLFGHVGAGDAHGDADVRLLQSRRVVDAVARHGHDGAEALAAFHDDQLLLRRRAGEYDFRVVPTEEIRLLSNFGYS